MLRNMVMASLGNLARNRLYAAINIGGLAVALAAAILIGLFVRDDLTFDRFLPGHEQVYRLSMSLRPPQGSPVALAEARSDFAAFLKADFRGVQSVARLVPGQPMVRHGQVEAVEKLYWADPSIFDVLPLPAYAGDLKAALARPDGLVLTRRLARKYFGRENVIGQGLDIEQQMGPVTQTHRLVVTAVLQDLPDNTHLDTEMFGSGLAPFSALSFYDARPKSFGPRVFTYVRLRPGVLAGSLIAALPAFVRRHVDPRPLLGGRIILALTPLTEIHYLHLGDPDMKPPGNRGATLAISGIGGLIVLMAAINFVSLMTARAGRRALEVGVRKSVGASRGHITVQFLGEAVGLSLLALVLAIGLSELMSPLATAIVGRPIRPDYPHEPGLLLILVGGSLALGLLAGVYPALVMASFRAASVLKGGPVNASGGGVLRLGLAVAQFAILIGLVISALVIWRQTSFALAKSMDHGGDRRLQVSQLPDCLLLRDRIQRLRGVQQAACGRLAIPVGYAPSDTTVAGGRKLELDMAPIDFDLMEMFGMQPLAGRLLSRSHPLDAVLLSGPSPDKQPSVVINATAARKLGFPTPQAAVGQMISWQRLNPLRTGRGDDSIFKATPSQIVGVVPDFSLQSVRDPIGPILYYVDPLSTRKDYLTVMLTGQDVAATLEAIGQQARPLGQKRPLVLRFYSQVAQTLYADIIAQTAAVAASAALAVLIACLGLFGLAVFTAERRIKEIGVRKAMGASAGDIVGLLLNAFTRPVLLANLIAWPLAWWAMQHWLSGFAYRIALSPWFFAAGGGAAVAVAALTVIGQCVQQARAKPAQALRYE